MIKALLGKIEGLFDKDFLFASFLPSLVFLGAVAATLAGVVGFDAAGAWIEGWTATQTAMVPVAAGVGVVVFAYILHGLRAVLLGLWSGMIGGPLVPFFRLGEEFSRWRYRKLRERAFGRAVWDGVFAWFHAEVKPHWNSAKPAMPDTEYEALLRTVEGLHDGMEIAEVKNLMARHVVDSFKRYSGMGRLEDAYQTVRAKIEEWENRERASLATERARLDRRFGTPDSIRATALGNVVESYNAYPFKRYSMEGEVFWPHLQHVMKDVAKADFLTTIQDFRILLDFCLTMASLGVLYGVLAALGGPWLWLDARFWGIIAVVAFLVSYGIYYRVAVFVAMQYGDLIRASFDLFRLQLLYALWRKHPAMRSVELEIWKQISQLLVFGEVQDFEIRPRTP